MTAPGRAAVTVVTIAHGRHEHLRTQREHLLAVQPGGARHVVVAMDDPALAAELAGAPLTEVVALPGPFRAGLPLAAARNAGARAAIRGGAGVIVFLDVDCVPDPLLVDRYRTAARVRPDALLSGPVTYLPPDAVLPRAGGSWTALRSPHPARPSPPDGMLARAARHELFWSLSFAVTPATWSRVGEFCEDYTGYGGEDTDLAYAARAAGVGLVWVGGAHAYHQFHPVSAPPFEHVADIVRNARIFHGRWGTWPMEGWLEQFRASGLIRWDGERIELAAVTS